MAEIDCPVPPETDADGCYPLPFLFSLPAACPIPMRDGGPTCFGSQSISVDNHGHEVDGDWGPSTCQHDMAGLPDSGYVLAPRRPVMTKQNTLTENTTPPPPQLAQPPAEPAPTIPSVGVDSAVSQVKDLLPADTSPALIILAVAVFAALAAAFKFGPKMIKAKEAAAEKAHELELKKIEMEEKRQQKQDDQHGECKTARVTLETRVGHTESGITELKSGLKKLANKVEDLSDDLDMDFGGDDDDDDDDDDRRSRRKKKSRRARRDSDDRE